MKIIYVTDLHGSKDRYRLILEAAVRHGAKAVVNGGDMLPLDGDLIGSQRRFIEEFLAGHFAEYEKAGIRYLGMPGNDDLRIHDEVFNALGPAAPAFSNLAGRSAELGGFEFLGMPCVPDYPFRLKDRCRTDGGNFVFQRQLGPALLSAPDGFREVEDWPAYCSSLPGMEGELSALPKPANPRKAVYVIHSPPRGLGLDLIHSGAAVGSSAVTDFLVRTQPLLSLHGHIHESPEMSGKWMGRIVDTVCVQPGQSRNGVVYVLSDLAAMSLERLLEPF